MSVQVTSRFAAGYTVLELVVTVAIVGILLAVGIPSLSSLFDALEIKGASEEVYTRIQQARSEAIARDSEVYVNFSTPTATTWTYGLTTIDFQNTTTANQPCVLTVTDPTLATACALVINDGDATIHGADSNADGVPDVVDTDDKVLMLYTQADYDGIVMSLTGFDVDHTIMFEPAQGTAIGNTGSVILQSPLGKQLRINVAPLGQIRICTPDSSVNGYADC